MMIKAVLLDLDNTLLHNPDRQFAIAFLEAFDAHFRREFAIEHVSHTFRQGIQQLSQHRDGVVTNSDLMINLISDITQATTEHIQNYLSLFYETAYLELQSYTAQVETARELVMTLLGQDISVAIATNPIYPRSAVYKRLEWAGLREFRDAFAFVSHSDNMHFAKPHPGYYAEVIARIGVEPDEALMVGDSIRNDIAPAQQMGIHTVHVNDPDILKKINERVQNIDWTSQYSNNPLTSAMIFPQYKGNIGALFGLLAEVEDGQWDQHPDPHEWSILQILSHLQISEHDVQRPRLQKILEIDNPFLTAPPPPGPNIPVCHSDGMHIANQFRLERMQTVELLVPVTLEQWQRPARHSIFGMTTLLEMAHFTAQHDRLHINQLCQTLGNCD